MLVRDSNDPDQSRLSEVLELQSARQTTAGEYLDQEARELSVCSESHILIREKSCHTLVFLKGCLG